MLAKMAGVSFLISLLVLFAGPSALAELVDYTTDADFEQGTLVDVNYDSPNNDQLQLNLTEDPFVFINVAATGRGTIVRIDANADTEEDEVYMGEYRTAPEGLNASPSRTDGDNLGNVWAANRDIFETEEGSVVKIGIVIGGTRVNMNDSGEAIEDDDGDYLKGPFDYSTCIDRNGDELIRTSRGLGDILSWTGDAPEDECILIYQPLGIVGEEFHVSVDAANNVWVGQYPGMFYKLDGDSGAVLTSFDAGTFGCGGFGGLVDGDRILWSASIGENSLLYYDPADGSGNCIQYATGTNPWGLGIDSEGFIWNGLLSTNQIAKVDPTDFSIVDGFPKTSDPPFSAPEGVAVTPSDNNVWVANGGGAEVYRLDNSGAFISSIGVGQTPTGVAVDANGKVWVTNLTDDNVMRIDPDTGDGVVDLTVALGDGAEPDNYGNMTGFVPFAETATEGTWTVVTDSGVIDHIWDTIIWNTEPEASEPDGTSITVEARAANTQAGLANEDYIEISNDVPFSLTGQFIEIRATLMANDAGISPVLSNLAIDVKTASARKVCDVDENGIVDFRDIKGIFYSFGDTADSPDDPRDWNRDTMITKIDARGCIQECTDTGCGFPECEKPCKLEEPCDSEKYWRSKRHWKSRRHWKSTNRRDPAEHQGNHVNHKTEWN